MSAATRRSLMPRLRLSRRLQRGDRGRGPRPRRRLPGPRALAAVLLLLGVLVGAYFWVRQSSLVRVQRVTVTGVSGPDAGAIRAVLVRTAERMTTMDMSSGRLSAAVARYPVVRSVHVSTHFPHSATISVLEQVPVGVLDGTTVSARGVLLPSVNPASRSLPTITASSGPTVHAAARGAVTGTARADISLLAAAPYPILSRLTSAGWKPGRGLTVQVRNGPAIYFGDETRLAQKWRSVIQVLANPNSAGASYIDVTTPTRPAAGTGSDSQPPAPSSSSGTLTGTTPPSTTTSPQTTTTTGVTTG